MFPDSLYIPTPKDLQSQFAPISTSFNLVDTQNAAGIGINGPACSADQVCFWTYFSGEGEADAAQTVTNVQLMLVDEANNILTRFYRANSLSAAPGVLSDHALGQRQYFARHIGGTIIQLGGQFLRIFVNFSAGAVGNTARLFGHGYIIPRGNWQRG